MDRNSSKDSLVGIGGRNLRTNGNAPVTGLFAHRRVMSLTNTTTTTEDFNNTNNVDLFSRNRRSLSVASSDESDLQVRLGMLSVGSTKPAKSVLDDLLSSTEGGKHDYDWLLTPPGTPLVPSSDGKESQPTSGAPRRHSSVRSGFENKTSRLSVSQSESNHPSRPARSSSATRSSTQYTKYSNRNSNILNTSSASVSSYTRPSTPTNCSSSAARPSTASSRTTISRPSTPSRTRPSQTTRPSTPTSLPVRSVSRPSTPTSPTVRSASRPSTPTRRSLAPSLSSNGSRILPDFSHETPPNLRTTLPERPLSVGRSRPGAAMTVKGHVEATNAATMARRHPSPIVTRGRLAEPPTRGRPHANGETLESPRTRSKPIKTSTSESGTGFGRTISKKSLDMAIKHMDIRNGGIRPLSGSTLFPQSIRSGNTRTQQHGRAGSLSNGVNSKINGNTNNGYLENKVKPISIQHPIPYSSKLTDVDIYESSRYDAILLKEDLNDTSWLHTADENSDQCPLFDHGFEPLPEPYGPL